MSRFPWSPVTVERLLILRAQGLKLSRIADELGTTSSTIEHKLRRLRSQNPAQAPAACGPLIPSSRSSDPLVGGVAPTEHNECQSPIEMSLALPVRDVIRGPGDGLGLRIPGLLSSG